jgi:hypothetical protein
MWNTTQLERAAYGKDGGITHAFKTMYQGSVPGTTTCKVINKGLNRYSKNRVNRCNTYAWRNLAYWGLLNSDQPGSTYVGKALRHVNSGLKRYIWIDPPEKPAENPSSRFDLTLDLIEAVAEHKNFHALLTLTAWAREAIDMKIHRQHYHCARYSRKIFAHAVCTTPHLFIRWPLLAERYRDLIWTPPISDVSVPWFTIKWEELLEEIEREEELAREKNLPLPPKDLFEELNGKYLARIRN